ncbi:hypothetical protein [Gordonia soli]|uniref:Uncharacterized protein n=1 Tax=Gordonia soli NBRC 108243 TaxID=1223545 RepID=M0QRD4_9ACTN|nr:hypothetical protein [Gordonia soli]GAC71014.1 hypothetical protein GS4_47_00030 [Gordonia soli NBRC 108243]
MSNPAKQEAFKLLSGMTPESPDARDVPMGLAAIGWALLALTEAVEAGSVPGGRFPTSDQEPAPTSDERIGGEG